jgi:hypothetical protein
LQRHHHQIFLGESATQELLPQQPKSPSLYLFPSTFHLDLKSVKNLLKDNIELACIKECMTGKKYLFSWRDITQQSLQVSLLQWLVPDVLAGARKLEESCVHELSLDVLKGTCAATEARSGFIFLVRESVSSLIPVPLGLLPLIKSAIGASPSIASPAAELRDAKNI